MTTTKRISKSSYYYLLFGITTLFIIFWAIYFAMKSTINQTPPSPIPPIIVEHAKYLKYTHASDLFSIDYPVGWDIIKGDNGVRFIDETELAEYSVFFKSIQTLSPESPLAKYIQEIFGDETDFEILFQNEEGAIFQSVHPIFGLSIAEGHLIKKNQTAYLITFSTTEDKWNTQTTVLLQDLLATFNPKLPPPPAAMADVKWQLYRHPSHNFGFVYPENWEVITDNQGVIAISLAEQFTFSVEVKQASSIGQDSIALQVLAKDKTEDLASQLNDFQLMPPDTYQTSITAGYIINYFYTNELGHSYNGTMIVTGVENKLYFVSITAPSETYKTASAWFDPIMQSFQTFEE
ncbi:MAG: hypothetical protein B6242_11760 [Anaerolineaceae bacterium 4572_78]|nr:MAG: hypothetical protein B6242_11760 [Anaerolineaceae bacterium 4572_78]